MLSHVQLFVTLWTVAHQAPLSVGFSRQEYWSGLPFPPPEGLPDPGIEPVSPAAPAWQGDSSYAEPSGKPMLRSSRKKKVFFVNLTYSDEDKQSIIIMPFSARM